MYKGKGSVVTTQWVIHPTAPVTGQPNAGQPNGTLGHPARPWNLHSAHLLLALVCC